MASYWKGKVVSNEALELVNGVPRLDDYEPAGVDLCPEYWTPKEVGESRRMLYLGIEERPMPSADDPNKLVNLECVLFVEPGEVARVVANGSKRLVGVFEGDKIKVGTPFEITYQGEAENSTNNKKSHSWSVVELKKKEAR